MNIIPYKGKNYWLFEPLPHSCDLDEKMVDIRKYRMQRLGATDSELELGNMVGWGRGGAVAGFVLTVSKNFLQM
jgi:hypothetical protein